MSYKEYGKKLQPLSPVAVKLNQTEVHAPNHDTWGVVTCDSCGELFHIGPNRIYGPRTTVEACVKQFETLLAEDHRTGRPHVNGYELPD